jgi:hypothetical protein
VTHSFLLKGENSPQCLSCGSSLIVEHVLVACNALMHLLEQFFNERALPHQFLAVSSQKIVDLIKAIGFLPETVMSFVNSSQL